MTLKSAAPLDAFSLPMKRTDFIPWDSDIRDEHGMIRVPPAEDLAVEMTSQLHRNRWTSGFAARAQDGAVIVYEVPRKSDIVAVIARKGGRQVLFDSAPEEPDARVNEGIEDALDRAMRSFRPWSQAAARPIFASVSPQPEPNTTMSNSLRSDLIRLAHQKPELREHLLPLVKQAGKADQLQEYANEVLREMQKSEKDYGVKLKHDGNSMKGESGVSKFEIVQDGEVVRDGKITVSLNGEGKYTVALLVGQASYQFETDKALKSVGKSGIPKKFLDGMESKRELKKTAADYRPDVIGGGGLKFPSEFEIKGYFRRGVDPDRLWIVEIETLTRVDGKIDSRYWLVTAPNAKEAGKVAMDDREVQRLVGSGDYYSAVGEVTSAVKFAR